MVWCGRVGEAGCCAGLGRRRCCLGCLRSSGMLMGGRCVLVLA